jgi:hypothetical protein
MKINPKNSISGLKEVIAKLFELDFADFTFDKIDKNLPSALQEIYTIDAFIAENNCSYETIRFFANMDWLVKYEDLKLTENQFTFVTENQGNWYCKTSLNSDSVYIYNHEEFENGTALAENIETFLTTFAFTELSYNFTYLLGLNYNSFDKVKEHFVKTEALWTDKIYIIRPTSFYLIDDEILLDEACMTLATNNAEKFSYYKSKLDSYLFS